MSRARLVVATISLALVAPLVPVAGSVAAAPAPADGGGVDRFRIEVVSSAPDQVTGGDALIAVTLPDGVDATEVRIERNGTDVTDDLWVEIYALRELRYQKLMMRARIVDRPFVVLPRRTATPPGDF